MSPHNQISGTRREYSLTKGRKLHHLLFAAGFFMGSGFFFKLAIGPDGDEFAVAVGIILLGPATLLLLQALRCRLILEGDTVELRSAFRVQSARRDEIEGLRTIRNQYGQWTCVYLKHEQGAFNISDSLTGKADLEEWFKGIPDLDEREADEIEQKVSSQGSLGPSDTARSSKFDRAKAWAIGLSVLAGATSIPVMWVSYAPVYRAALIFLLASPPIGILLLYRFPLLFTVFKRKPNPRADLGFLIAWPGIGVMLSYQISNDPSHMVDATELTLWFLLAFACFVAFLFQTAWNSPSRAAVFSFVAIVGGMYSVGLVNALNTLPDRSAPTVYQTTIVKMHESQSSKGTRYYLQVAPWGPIVYPDDVDVPMRTYKGSRVGDPVCFGLHRGYLQAPWYSQIPCSTRQSYVTPR